jgi:acyl-CoA reductase-like NAD-dependent aldehyde dehydrogenase
MNSERAERMKMVSKAVVRAKDAFGEEWNKMSPKEKLFFIKKTLEFMVENDEEPDMLMLLKLARRELEQVMELERRVKMMGAMLEAKATV